jgi:hypothetical protein
MEKGRAAAVDRLALQLELMRLPTLSANRVYDIDETRKAALN